MSMMEPMMMGSPSSPSSPGAHGQSQYLPSYLLGDPASATASPSSPPKASMNKSKLWSSPWAGQGVVSPTGRQGDTSSVFNTSRASESRPAPSGVRGKDRAGAPPVQGLLETIHTPTSGTPGKADYSLHASRLGMSFTGTPGSAHTPAPGSSGPGQSGDQSRLFQMGRKTPPSPAQMDPFYTQGETLAPDDELDDTWVTVFGFPPAATSFILQQFSQYGNIIKHVVATDGNWMHLHFQSRLQAKKALSKNGKIFGGSIMVGVTPCIDKSLMESCTESGCQSILKSPLQHSMTENSSMSSASKTAGSIRPLAAAYKAASSDHEVTQQSNTPQKNNSVMSKAMEYMFGW